MGTKYQRGFLKGNAGLPITPVFFDRRKKINPLCTPVPNTTSMLALANRSKVALQSNAPRARAIGSRRGLATRGEQRAPLPTHQYFQPSVKLTEQRKSHPGLHYIFLEGVGGSGKGSLLGRLSKVHTKTSTIAFSPFYGLPARLTRLLIPSSDRILYHVASLR